MSNKPDEDARKYMGGERAHFLDKVRFPGWLHALLLSGAALSAIAMVASHLAVLAPFAAAPSLLAWALLSTIRMTVTSTHLHLQYGVFGPKVALADIVSVDAMDYQWWQYAGWGIRRAADGGVAYSIPGRGGRAIKVVWQQGEKRCQLIATAEHATELAAAIDVARTAVLARTLDDARADPLPVATTTTSSPRSSNART